VRRTPPCASALDSAELINDLKRLGRSGDPPASAAGLCHLSCVQLGFQPLLRWCMATHRNLSHHGVGSHPLVVHTQGQDQGEVRADVGAGPHLAAANAQPDEGPPPGRLSLLLHRCHFDGAMHMSVSARGCGVLAGACVALARNCASTSAASSCHGDWAAFKVFQRPATVNSRWGT
jgi:hypothetical protein